MKYVRMIVWALLLVLLVAFSITNWQPVEVKIWDNLILETKIPALVVVSFLLGLVPMWLIHRGVRWRLQRRISGLESVHRSAAVREAALDAAPEGLAPDRSPPPGL
jgi:putative membrane protein